tara:strand:+ start:118 stop:312 length:195 start_codon:yes stop_codon:yes gene_type:complete
MSYQDDLEKLDVEQIMMCVRALDDTRWLETVKVKRCIRKLKKQYTSWMDEESANEVFKKFLIGE